MDLGSLINVGGALVAGAIAKKVGKSDRTGPAPLHKIGAPLAAAAGAAALEAARALATGDSFNPDVVQAAALHDGGTAVVVHTVYKNGTQFVKSLLDLLF